MENFISLCSQICIYTTVLLVYIIFKHLKRKKYVDSDAEFIYNSDCPICFEAFSRPVKAACGHGFCLDCLYTYWRKPSWNNLCPLCRKRISNLRPIQNERYNYSENSEEISKKIKKMSTKLNLYYFTISDISRSTFYPCVFCAVFLLIWTYAVSNLNRTIYFVIRVYNSLYDMKTEINI